MPTAFEVCDRFAFLKDKVIKEQGTIADLKINKKIGSAIQQFIEGTTL